MPPRRPPAPLPDNQNPDKLRTGSHTLQIQPEALPDAITAFTEAREAIDVQIADATRLLRTQAHWAEDPVSVQTARAFDQRTNDGADAGLTVLTGYKSQLTNAIEALTKAQDAYAKTEGANSTRFNA
jgi:hypothetical protein